jgi:protein-tyrosine-phosphatase
MSQIQRTTQAVLRVHAPTAVHPETIAVMEEAGLDISGHNSKSVREFIAKPIDFVISFRDDAKLTRPLFFPRCQVDALAPRRSSCDARFD